MAERTGLRTVAVDVDERPDPPGRLPPWPWWLEAVVGAFLVAAAGLLLISGAAVVGWLTSSGTDLTAALGLSSRIFLLAHGGAVEIGGQLVTLVPLTLTLVQMVLGQPVAALAARHAGQAEGESDDTGEVWVDGGALTLRVAAVWALSYTAAVAVVAALVGGGAWRALLGAVVVGLVAGGWGASRALSYDPRHAWPGWLRAVPAAVGWAVLLCLTAGLVVLVIAVVRGWDRVMALGSGLEPGVGGAVVLVLMHLAWLPNLVVWATAWVLGAGLSLGEGSLVNQSITDVGFLPAIPVLGAVPPAGPGSDAHHWWLLVGVAAGALAGLLVTLARPRARIDETALVGGLAGVVAGGAVALVCMLASGGLGTGRLAQLGVQTVDIWVVAPSLLGLAGLVTGVVVGLLRTPRPAPEEPVDAAAGEEPPG